MWWEVGYGAGPTERPGEPPPSCPCNLCARLSPTRGSVLGSVPPTGCGPLKSYSVLQGNFRHLETHSAVSREELMMVLAGLEQLQIRALFSQTSSAISLGRVVLEVASEAGRGPPASSVELCMCPANYRGDSCQVRRWARVPGRAAPPPHPFPRAFSLSVLLTAPRQRYLGWKEAALAHVEFWSPAPAPSCP